LNQENCIEIKKKIIIALNTYLNEKCHNILSVHSELFIHTMMVCK